MANNRYSNNDVFDILQSTSPDKTMVNLFEPGTYDQRSEVEREIDRNNREFYRTRFLNPLEMGGIEGRPEERGEIREDVRSPLERITEDFYQSGNPAAIALSLIHISEPTRPY